MITLDWVKIKAFRSFVDETTFQLPSSGLILVNGKNLQTNDASGTGKSSLFLATAYVLNILPSGQTAVGLQSFLTKEKMQVTAGLTEANLGKITVGRGFSTFIEYGGKRYEGATLVNEHLETVFGLTSEMLFTMAYRPQSTGGLFLSKNDTEKKDFLSALLGLDMIEAAVDVSDKAIKELTKELLSINTQLKSKDEVLQKIVITDITTLVADTAKVVAEISDWEADREHWEAKLKLATACSKEREQEIEAKYKALKLVVSQRLDDLNVADTLRKNAIEKNNKETLESIEICNKALDWIKGVKKRLPVLQEEIEALKKSTCFTCNQPWVVASANEKLTKAKEELEHSFFCLGKEKEFKDQLLEFKQKLQTYVKDPEIDWAKEELTQLKIKQAGEIPIGTGSGEANMLSKNYRKMQELTTIVSKNNTEIAKQKELQSLHASISKEVALLNKQKAEKEEKLQQETDFCKALGKEGFLGSIFDEVLSEIVEEINTKLATVANMSSITFDFKTEVLNTKGVMKKSILPVITNHGHEAKLSTLSGGMLSSLEIITDLAVKEVIERRTGRQIGFYFIDEAFNGIGKPSVEACLEILQQSASNKAFYLIDHNTETKEVFSKVIEIEMSQGVSSLKL